MCGFDPLDISNYMRISAQFIRLIHLYHFCMLSAQSNIFELIVSCTFCFHHA